jgi:hypothetical protein
MIEAMERRGMRPPGSNRAIGWVERLEKSMAENEKKLAAVRNDTYEAWTKLGAGGTKTGSARDPRLLLVAATALLGGFLVWDDLFGKAEERESATVEE